MILSAKNISKSYGALRILRDVSLEIGAGEVVSIVGASGAGKSTLLQIIGSLDKPDAGEVIIEGKSIFTLNDSALAAFRNQRIGFIFQFHHLLPEFTALENVCLPAYIGKKNTQQTIARAKELLAILGVEKRATHKPSELSGGEQQRVAVARALINQPAIVMADEPSGNLDSENARELHRLFFDLRKKFGQTLIIVTHNQELAAMADRTLVMRDGQLNI